MKNTLITIIFAIILLGTTPLISQSSWNYISPSPGSEFINIENTIAFRQGECIDISSVKSNLLTVKGSMSGIISGDWILSADSKTLIFHPDKDYKYNEKISVDLSKGIQTVSGKILDEVSFDFYTLKQDNQDLKNKFYREKAKEMEQELYRNNKSAISEDYRNTDNTNTFPPDFPKPYISEYDNPADGYTFLTYIGFMSPMFKDYMVIIDNYGTPVYYQKARYNAIDFKVLYNDNLAYCNFSFFGLSDHFYVIMDKKFNPIDSLYMGNGYKVDEHELLYLPNGDHFLMSYDPQLVDMSQVVTGGDPNATVIGLVIQKLDINDNVVFQWRSWDHFEITDSNEDLLSNNIDYVHGNAMELDDNESTLLVSSRNFDEITKINLTTGEVIWRFGKYAKNNEFTFTNDTVGFAKQHDIRKLPNGNYTVYDNGNLHMPPFSQAVEYQLDEINKTATLVWNYKHEPSIFGPFTGSQRRLDNGNVLVCWGGTFPTGVSEIRYNKELQWEISHPPTTFNYRAVKENWITDLFEPNQNVVDYGTFSGYTPIPRIIVLTNNSNEDIEITSTHNHFNSYNVVTQLPLSIPANGSTNMTINFFPTQEGQINDVLTLCYENNVMDSLPRRIARQVELKGYVADPNPPAATIDPSNGTVMVDQTAILHIDFDESVVKADGSVLKYSDLPTVIIFKTEGPSGADVPYTASIDVWKQHITIVPDTLYPDQNYYLELSGNAVSDIEGNIMADSAYSYFTTGQEFGIEDNKTDNISVFPNPAKNTLFIKTTDKIPDIIKIINISGQEIMEIQNPADEIIEIKLVKLKSGIYFLEMIFNESNEALHYKIIKQ